MQLYGFVVPLEIFSYGKFQAIAPRSARGLLPYEILEIVDRELSLPRFVAECTPSYIATIRAFLSDHVAHRLATVRKSRGMFEALERSDEWDEETDLSMGATGDSIIFPDKRDIFEKLPSLSVGQGYRR